MSWHDGLGQMNGLKRKPGVRLRINIAGWVYRAHGFGDRVQSFLRRTTEVESVFTGAFVPFG